MTFGKSKKGSDQTATTTADAGPNIIEDVNLGEETNMQLESPPFMFKKEKTQDKDESMMQVDKKTADSAQKQNDLDKSDPNDDKIDYIEFDDDILQLKNPITSRDAFLTPS